jgi:hypothetical protein
LAKAADDQVVIARAQAVVCWDVSAADHRSIPRSGQVAFDGSGTRSNSGLRREKFDVTGLPFVEHVVAIDAPASFLHGSC